MSEMLRAKNTGAAQSSGMAKWKQRAAERKGTRMLQKSTRRSPCEWRVARRPTCDGACAAAPAAPAGDPALQSRPVLGGRGAWPHKTEKRCKSSEKWKQPDKEQVRHRRDLGTTAAKLKSVHKIAHLVCVEIAVVINVAEIPDLAQDVDRESRLDEHALGGFATNFAINRVACSKNVFVVGLLLQCDGPLHRDLRGRRPPKGVKRIAASKAAWEALKKTGGQGSKRKGVKGEKPCHCDKESVYRTRTSFPPPSPSNKKRRLLQRPERRSPPYVPPPQPWRTLRRHCKSQGVERIGDKIKLLRSIVKTPRGTKPTARWGIGS